MDTNLKKSSAEFILQHIRPIRRLQGKTIQDVSQMTGLSHTTIRRIEHGDLKVYYGSVMKMMDALGISAGVAFDIGKTKQRLTHSNNTKVLHNTVSRGWKGAYSVPLSLKDLRGPYSGKIELPISIAWNGNVIVDIDDIQERAWAYSRIIEHGNLQEQCSYLNSELLIQLAQSDSISFPRSTKVKWKALLDG